MSVTTPNMTEEGAWRGGLSDLQIGYLEQIQAGKEEVEIFYNYLWDLPEALCETLKESNKTIQDYLKETGVAASSLRGRLRPYQTVGAAFLYFSPKSILTDGVGLGKTAVVSALLNFLYERGELDGRFLFSVPLSILDQVESEVRRFTGLRIGRIPTDSRKVKKFLEGLSLEEYDGFVCASSTLSTKQFILSLAHLKGRCGRLADVMILDESSLVKNYKTRAYESVARLARGCKRVHFLNATVMELSILDIYNQLDLVDGGVLPRRYKFEDEFCVYKQTPYWVSGASGPYQKYKRGLAGYKNEDLFKRVRCKYFLFGRTTRTAGIEVADHTYKIEKVSCTKLQKRLIRQGYRHQEVLNCLPLIEGYSFDSEGGVPKMDRAVEITIESWKKGGVVVYAFHKESQLELKRRLESVGWTVGILNGDTVGDARISIQDDFNSGKLMVLVTNVTRGLNLHGGKTMILYSLPTNPATMEQIVGRIDRHIDLEPRDFILMIYEDSPESRLLYDVAKKRDLGSKALTGTSDTALGKFIQSDSEGVLGYMASTHKPKKKESKTEEEKVKPQKVSVLNEVKNQLSFEDLPTVETKRLIRLI